MPSFRPLSTLIVERIILGTFGSVTTALPSAASVGVSNNASKIMYVIGCSGNSHTATAVPATIVKGRPIKSNRAGICHERRNNFRSNKAASLNNTSTNAISTNTVTNSASTSTAVMPNPNGEQISPNTVNTIGPDISNWASFFEIKP